MRLGFHPQTVRMGRTGAEPDAAASVKVTDSSSLRPQGRKAGPAPRVGRTFRYDDSQPTDCRVEPGRGGDD